jgi:hypothetical protein
MFLSRIFGKENEAKQIEGDLFQYMVNKQHVPLDILRNLRIVEKETVLGDQPVGVMMFRIFHPGSAKKEGLKIEDYDNLDDNPELVLYEGYYQLNDGRADNIQIEKQPEN